MVREERVQKLKETIISQLNDLEGFEELLGDMNESDDNWEEVTNMIGELKSTIKGNIVALELSEKFK